MAQNFQKSSYVLFFLLLNYSSERNENWQGNAYDHVLSNAVVRFANIRVFIIFMIKWTQKMRKNHEKCKRAPQNIFVFRKLFLPQVPLII